MRHFGYLSAAQVAALFERPPERFDRGSGTDLLSVALGIVTVVASIVLWMVLDVTGIFDKINGLLGEIGGSESGGALDLKKIASLGQVASFATIIAVVNVVLLTALSMLTAVLYNISATLVGGVGVTLTDD